MSTTRDDGGQAFPGQWDHGNGQIQSWSGMSLLDWFAGQALIAIASKFSEAADIACQAVPVAEDAYRIADAMIAERSKP